MYRSSQFTIGKPYNRIVARAHLIRVLFEDLVLAFLLMLLVQIVYINVSERQLSLQTPTRCLRACFHGSSRFTTGAHISHRAKDSFRPLQSEIEVDEFNVMLTSPCARRAKGALEGQRSGIDDIVNTRSLSFAAARPFTSGHIMYVSHAYWMILW